MMQQDDTLGQMETRSIPLKFEGKGVELLWRGPLALLLMVLVIPAAWGITVLVRWFLKNIVTEDGRELVFTGKAVEIFGHGIAFILVLFLPALPDFFTTSYEAELDGVLQLLSFVFSTLIFWHILRWVVSRAQYEEGSSFSFAGSFWNFFKRNLLWTFIGIPGLILFILGIALREPAGVLPMLLLVIGGIMLGLYLISWYSIIFYNWIAGNIKNGSSNFSFKTPVSTMVWRSVVFFIFCVPFITIPWAFTWFFRWVVSQATYEQAVTPQFSFSEDEPAPTPDSDSLPYPSIFK